MFRIVGDSKALDAGSIPILECWDKPRSSKEQKLFRDIWNKFHNLPNIQEILDALANARRKIRYGEIVYYFQNMQNFVLLDSIQKSHIDYGLMSESEPLQPSEELSVAESMEKLLDFIKLIEAVENEQEVRDLFQVFGEMHDNMVFTARYNTHEISTNNNLLTMFDFPKVYMEQLERLLWPKWYTACFTKSYHNSSLWAKYADGHKGVCLIFEAVKTGDSHILKLNPRSIPFYGVSYADKPDEIDFFRTICRLPLGTLMKLWYTDQDGNISECAAHIGPDGDEDTWRKSYWENFFRDISIKTRDWEYEQEYRLILEDGLSQFDKKDDRILTYNFNSLKGIIFGMRTSTEDKVRIIEIIKKKCEEYNRNDFKFFQTYYSPESGHFCKYEIPLR